MFLWRLDVIVSLQNVALGRSENPGVGGASINMVGIMCLTWLKKGWLMCFPPDPPRLRQLCWTSSYHCKMPRSDRRGWIFWYSNTLHEMSDVARGGNSGWRSKCVAKKNLSGKLFGQMPIWPFCFYLFAYFLEHQGLRKRLFTVDNQF